MPDKEYIVNESLINQIVKLYDIRIRIDYEGDLNDFILQIIPEDHVLEYFLESPSRHVIILGHYTKEICETHINNILAYTKDNQEEISVSCTIFQYS